MNEVGDPAPRGTGRPATPLLTDSDMPEIFRTADRASGLAQRRFLASMRAQLIALALGAALGAYTLHWPDRDTDAAGLLAGLAFAIAGVLRASMSRTRPERSWYDGRAVAESAKSMAWRYAVGGKPFPADLPAEAADEELVRRLRDLPVDLAGLALEPSSGPARQITDAMRSLRHSPLPVRVAAYEEGRLRDQQHWYARKARLNRRRAARWNGLLIVVEGLAAVAAVLKAVTDLALQLLPVTGALLAAATAWLQTKQHEALASAYTVASFELSSIAELIGGVDDETEWAAFVDDAENAISREHTMWKAKRSEKTAG